MALRRSATTADDRAMMTAVAIDKNKNTQFAVRWALDNLIDQNYNQCVLLHVRSRSLQPQDSDECPSPTEDAIQQLFRPYRGFCARKGIVTKEVVLHADSIPSALIGYVTNNPIRNIVLGASTRSSVKKFWSSGSSDIPSSLVKCAPESCGVYIIAKDKVQTFRESSQPPMPRKGMDPSANGKLSYLSDSAAVRRRASSAKISRNTSRILPYNKFVSTNGTVFPKPSKHGQGPVSSPPDSRSDSNSTSPDIQSLGSTDTLEQLLVHDISPTQSSVSMMAEKQDSFESYNNQSQQQALEAKIESLKLTLKASMDMYNSVCTEAVVAANDKASEFNKVSASEALKLDEDRVAEEMALTLTETKREKSTVAVQALKVTQKLSEMETQKTKYVEIKEKHAENESKSAKQRFSRNNIAMYRVYTIQEIEAATDHFSSSHKIAEGGYGPVYIGTLDHTAVAIKILRQDLSQGHIAQGLRQFQQEVEVLSCMRHPNMVLLMGACPEYGCLVYEYMDNGSLEDRLFRKHNSPSIPCKIRFRIAAQIATALLFLHQAKPEPVVHRDLKPANILLDKNYVCKISDVGLARLVPPSADSQNGYCMTAAAGTFYYIDPEYQQTGMLSVKSDLFSLGVVLLQILTGRPPIGLSYNVEEAIENGTFSEALDPTVPDWPEEEALSMAKLALKCCEMRKRDRPDLASVVMPELNRLRKLVSDDDGSRSADDTVYVSRSCKSEPHVRTPRNNQMNMKKRRKWRKSASLIQSSFSNEIKSERPPVSRKHTAKPDMKHQLESCWSFVGCSPSQPHLRRIKSLSYIL